MDEIAPAQPDDSATGELPRRLPHVSPSRQVALRRLFALLQAVSPWLAARTAFGLFLRPFQRNPLPEDAAMLARARHHHLDAAGDAVAVYEWGAGERTAIIVHGWGSRAARFTPLAASLEARGWRVLAFDAPGHGAVPGKRSSLPQFMSALDAVATRFGPPRALVGHSLGALAIACRFGAQQPAWASTLDAIVLVSMPSGAPFLVESFLHMLGIRAAARRHMVARFQRRFGALPEHFAAMPGAARFPGRLLVVHDADDDIVPASHSAALLPQVGRARMLATRGLGHSGLTRDPATVEAITAFINAPAADASAAGEPPAAALVPGASPASSVYVRRADLANAADAAAVVDLLDAYARDPRGGCEGLSTDVRQRLIPGLRAHPMARVWLAFDGNAAVGVCVGFIGFSTFRAVPLLNLHDVAVLKSSRGRGIGLALLQAAEQGARAEGCGKLTLEVQEDNAPARRLYERFGFQDVRYGDSGPTRFLGKPLLS